MRRPYSPFADGAFVTSPGTDIRWVPRKDGSRQLKLSEICRLKRHTADEANQCLANKHVAMVGDSLTRFQYICLAHLAGDYWRDELRRIRPHAYRAGCGYLDFAYLTEPFALLDWEGAGWSPRAERHSVYVDSVHYQPWVYEELNQVLLNVLCKRPGGGRRRRRRVV